MSVSFAAKTPWECWERHATCTDPNGPPAFVRSELPSKSVLSLPAAQSTLLFRHTEAEHAQCLDASESYRAMSDNENGAIEPIISTDTPAQVELDPTLDFLAGTVAGVSGLVVGFPFDTVKYRFQNPAPNVQYRSTFHALATITRAERLRGLFKGISSPLASAPVLNGLLFATYRFLLKVQVRSDAPEPTLGQIFLAGAGCGLASTLLTTPIELIKTQQQKQQQHLSTDGLARVASARTVASRIFRTGGVRALYRGLTATILRDVGGFGMYFYGYEATLRLFAPPMQQHRATSQVEETTLVLAHSSWAGLLLAGGAAGVLGWVATFPFDVLKTRIQAQQQLPAAAAATDSNTWNTARAMYAESGSRVFWRGLAPTLVRAVPVNMAVFGTFEGVVWAFS